MDKIVIGDLTVSYRVGVPELERAQPQRLLLSLELEQGFAAAAAGDDLAHTIDYDALCRRLLHFGEGRTWKLIETLAEDIARMVLEEFRPETVSVEVKKFVIPETRYVSVRVTRSSVQG
jgi:FolB domain-containing protein